jgi:hypothetical protein
MVPQIRASLDECVATLRSIPATAWASAGQHPTRGSVSVEALVDTFLVRHAEEHTAQIAATLQALHASPRQ